MKTQKASKLVSLGLLLLISSGSVFAERGSEGGKRRGPPPEALEACAASNLDDACSFTSQRRGDVSGICIVPKNDDSVLACKPQRGSRKDDRSEEQ